MGVMRSFSEDMVNNERVQKTSLGLSEGDLVQRKVIQRAHLTLLVEDLDKEFNNILKLIEGERGFVEHSGTWENEQQRSGELTLRVPVASFSLVLGQLEELGQVEGRELGGQDVTFEYVDIEARMRNLQRQEERFLAILEKANTVDEILGIERELERVRGELESLTARLKNLDNLTGLATINVSLRQLKISKDKICIRAAPRQVKIFVLSPAGLLLNSLS